MVVIGFFWSKSTKKRHGSERSKAIKSTGGKLLNFFSTRGQHACKSICQHFDQPHPWEWHEIKWFLGDQKWIKLITMEGKGRDIMQASVALMLRFQHHIRKDMNQWNESTKCVCAKNQSGLNYAASITKKTEALFQSTT
jgi:hypothetical protein